MRRLVWSAVLSVVLFVLAVLVLGSGVFLDNEDASGQALVLALGSVSFAVLSLRER